MCVNMLIILCHRYLVLPHHNIIQIHNNDMWDWQRSTEYFIVHSYTKCEEWSGEYCQSHIRLLWI